MVHCDAMPSPIGTGIRMGNGMAMFHITMKLMISLLCNLVRGYLDNALRTKTIEYA